MRADAIIQKARDRARLEVFDSESFREGLEIAADGLSRHPLRTSQGAALLEDLYIQGLVSRLQVADYARRHPEIHQAPIERPIFIMGLPRTGTTMVSYLLAADRRLRSLLRWEVAHPFPPPQSATLYSDPRLAEMKEAEAGAGSTINAMAQIHYEAPDGPTECTFVMASDFKSLFVEALTAWDPYSEWYLGADLTSAYAYHRLFLQTHQHEAPGIWNLKLPSHTLGIRVLMKMYPDARIIWTHRDPYTSAASLFSMISKAERLTLSESDFEHIRRTYPKQLAEHARRPMAVMDESERDPFYHLFYGDLMRDPMREMRKLYLWLGEEIGPKTEAAMQAWLAANPQGRFGKHSYGLDAFGLAKTDLMSYFEDYRKRFDIEIEG